MQNRFCFADSAQIIRFSVQIIRFIKRRSTQQDIARFAVKRTQNIYPTVL